MPVEPDVLTVFCLNRTFSASASVFSVNFFVLKRIYNTMCPLWHLHICIIYILMLVSMWILTSSASKIIAVNFEPSQLLIEMENTAPVKVFSNEIHPEDDVLLFSDIGQDLIIYHDRPVIINSGLDGNWTGLFNVTGNFLGKSDVRLRVDSKNGRVYESNKLNVTIVRQKRLIDRIFIVSVAVLVSIIYINFGCAIDFDVVKKTLKRPVGPAIGLACQFIFMPLVSYALGLLLFYDSTSMKLGMFFTGISPSGGASNIWTVALEGNVNLSITLTTLSTLAAFGMIPFWLFTLGSTIFDDGGLATPYEKIASYAVSLIVPLSIGIAIQRFFPRIGKFLVKALKPFSVFLILFIVIFAVITNVYLFQLFTWKIVVAGFALPWLGYLAGLTAAIVCKRPLEDVLAISVETGIQNTGITFFMLGFSLPQPEADLTAVIPTAVAIMTPIPLLILMIALRLVRRKKQFLQLNEERNSNFNLVK